MDRYHLIISGKRLVPTVVLLVCTVALLNPVRVMAQNGRITGKVTDTRLEAGLPGANVVIAGTYLGAATDRQGYYIISNVPPGTYDISVAFIGYETGVKTQIQILADRVVTLDFELRPGDVELGEVMVTAGRLAQSQATALHAQNKALTITSIVASDLIGTFPDVNASETLTRIPGISITRDHGEGRFAVLRGMSPEFNSSLINGERIPSAENDERFVALDVLPASLIESIEVAKAATPEMDGDAIGGTINLIMKDAPDRRIFNAAAGYGLTQREVPERQHDQTDITRLNVVAGDVFLDGKLGYIASGSFLENYLKTDNRELSYSFEDAGVEALADGVDEVEKQDYEINRERFGLNGSLLFKPVLGHKFYFRAFYSRFSDQEYRHGIQTSFSDEPEIKRRIKDRLEVQTIQYYSVGAEHTLISDATIDYHYTFTKNRGERKGEFESEYLLAFGAADRTLTSNQVFTAQNFGLTLPDDPLGYAFDEAETVNRDVKDWDHVVAFNVKKPFKSSRIRGNFKFGLKGRFKERNLQRQQLVIKPVDGEGIMYLQGGVNTSHFPDISEEFQPEVPVQIEDDFFDRPDKDAENYDADEDILAGYVQSELRVGTKFMVLAGFRLERTKSAYVFRPTLAQTGDRKESDESYSDFLPSIHLRYKLQKDTNLRLALGRGLSRPEYFDLVPFDFIRKGRRNLGNPALDPVRATSVDLMLERFEPRFAGLMSVGVFYKTFTNPAVQFKFADPDNPEVDILQKRNSDGDGRIFGVELALLKDLEFIGLNGFRLLANYTFTDSNLDFDSQFVEDQERPDSRLENQSRHIANLALSYENESAGFSGQIAWKYQSEQLESLGDSAEEDEFLAPYDRFDLTLNKRIIPGVTLFVEGRNLNNESFRQFITNPETGKKHDIEVEKYGRSAIAGFKLNF